MMENNDCVIDFKWMNGVEEEKKLGACYCYCIII